MGLNEMPERIKKYIENETSGDRPRETNKLSVTELIGCLRKSWFDRKAPEPKQFKTRFAFWRGNLMDREITSLYPRNQVRVTHRVRGTPIIVAGRIDFIDDDGAVADLKTTDGMFFIKRDGAKDTNVKQVLFYAYYEGVNKARLYYMSMGEWEQVDVDASNDKQEKNLNEIESNAKILYDALLSGKPPEFQDGYNTSYWECKGKEWKCEYYDRCYGKKK